MAFNKQQLEIINSSVPRIAVNAGAGVGKSTTLKGKVLKDLEEGIYPFQITVITFTKDACNSVRQKLEDEGQDVDAMTIKTLHAFCYNIYKTYCDIRHQKPFKPISDVKKSFGFQFWKIIAAYKDKLPHKSLLQYIGFINNCKINKKTHTELLKKLGFKSLNELKQKVMNSKDHFPREVFEVAIYAEYEEWKTAEEKMDFTDMLLWAIKAIATCPRTKNIYQTQIKSLHIDESQDTNALIIDLLNLLITEDMKITMYGDLRQAIYSFMNASPKQMISFSQQHGFTEMSLNKNYRSSEEIVRNANTFIRNYPEVNRGGDLVNSKPKFGEMPRAVNSEDELMEHHRIVQLLNDFIAQGYKYSDIAILYRTNAQAMLILDHCVENEIPFTIKNDSASIFSRGEMIDLFAYLKIFNSLETTTMADFKRICNKPTRYIANNLWRNLMDFDEDQKGFGHEFFEVTHDNENLNKFSKELYAHYMKARKLSIKEQLEYIRVIVGYEQWWFKSDYAEGMFDLGIYVNAIQRLAEKYPTYKDLVKHIKKIKRVMKEENEDEGLRLYTIHGSKGLEFKVCIVIGICDRLYPLYMATECDSAEDKSGFEEEARLFYVASTRPIEQLVYSEIIGKLGNKKVFRSPFIEQIKTTTLIEDINTGM